MIRSGEYLDLDTIIARQEETTGLYGSALHQRAFYYKQHLYNRVKPSIVTLGSSRVLQIRSSDFQKSFVNLGSMSSLDETAELAGKLFGGHKPDLVILGVDVWWFHPDAETAVSNRSTEDVSPTAHDLLEPFYWFIKGKLSRRDVIATVKGKTPHTGIAAITRGDGYSADGSYHYNSILSGLQISDDPAFAVSLEKIRQGDKIYAQGKKISQMQWKKFTDLLALLQEKKISVAVFLPPFAPTVGKAMASDGNYGYIDEARQKIGKWSLERDIPFFDFHDAASLGATDCEFIDGHHGGPVVYQRILLNMAVGNKDVRKTARLAEIGWNIENYGGRASLLENETDFLGIGCEKK